MNDQLRQHEFTVRLADATLRGDLRGDSPRIAFLHGFGGNRKDWDRLWDALPQEPGLLRYDQRGFGNSDDRASEPFSHTADLLALLDAQEIDRIDLVGLSFGGAISCNFALDHPDRVNRLVLISPILMGWDWSDEWRQHWRPITDAARSGNMTLAKNLWWENPLFATTRASDAVTELRASIESFSGAQWIKDNQQPILPDIDRLYNLSVPTLLLTGTLDLPDFQLVANLLEAAAPNLIRIDYSEAGHLLNLECAGQVARDIGDFLR
jgi:3-oxoadipate enol-lactonase/2-succinyl-6-hydroxy-2,4-cyclohexadiene-1-carboxylate synthase